MENTQQKINMALMVINHLTNTLNIVNTEMRLQPSQGDYAIKFQKEREGKHTQFAKMIIDLANDMGDYMNDYDAMSEEELYVINPIFDLINKEDYETI